MFVKLSVFRILTLNLLLVENSSIRIVDWHIYNNFKKLITLYAVSIVGEIVAFISR